MKKNEIIDYLKSRLIDDVEYLTVSCFIDKEHRRLVSFICGSSKLPDEALVDMVINDGKK